LLVILVFVGCEKRWEEVTIEVRGPNWSSDNKVIFLKEVITWEWEERPPFVSEHVVGIVSRLVLMEVDTLGEGLESLGVVRAGGKDYFSEFLSTGSAGEWVCIGIPTGIDNVTNYVTEGEIWVMRRDGSGLEKVGEGLHPDFSPDASRIVYEKPDSGIWVMDRDGSNNHCIVPDADAKYPAWSPDDSLIGYGYFGMQIYNIKSDSIIREYERVGIPDWGPSGSNEIIVEAYGGPLIIDIVTGEIDSIGNLINGNRAKWSPDGLWFIAYDGDWFVISADGSNKWYLKDKIEGGEQ